MIKLVFTAIATLCIVLGLAHAVFANNPGGHEVDLTWTDASCVAPSCTFNIYRGTATGVCGTGKTPYANSSIPSFADDNVTAGTTYFYAITAYPATGGESTCTAEVQVAVSSAQGTTPSVPQGQGH